MSDSLTCRNHPDVIEGLRNCARCGGTFCADCVVNLQGRDYCASCKNEQVLDISSGVNTADLDLAPISKRVGAFMVDVMIFAVPMWAVMGFMMMPDLMRGRQPNVQFIRWLSYGYVVVFLVYDALMLSSRGQTLGKMALKLKVVRADGTALTPGQAWGRAGVRGVISAVFSLIDYLPAFFTKDRTCIHDMVAKTRVVNLA
ncbi:MAG TPA: RDD family protein [Thermoanaerobaculia bacterium]|nr:RDD family protein [Thermoanaerobaculia bacterium]